MRISGIVQRGQQRARLLGFPTANLACCLPVQEGIYAALCEIPHLSLSHMTTLAYYKDELLEAHLLNHNLDLYDQRINVYLTHFIRPPVVYENDQQMVALIHQDVIQLKQIIKGGGS